MKTAPPSCRRRCRSCRKQSRSQKGKSPARERMPRPTPVPDDDQVSSGFRQTSSSGSLQPIARSWARSSGSSSSRPQTTHRLSPASRSAAGATESVADQKAISVLPHLTAEFAYRLTVVPSFGRKGALLGAQSAAWRRAPPTSSTRRVPASRGKSPFGYAACPRPTNCALISSGASSGSL